MSLIGGQIFPIELFGLEFEVCEQGLALLSLVPIWLYRGRQGHHSKAFQYACYAFYPVHMLILGLIQLTLKQLMTENDTARQCCVIFVIK